MNGYKTLDKLIAGKVVEPYQALVRYSAPGLIQIAIPTECFDPAEFDGKPYTSFRFNRDAAAGLAETLQALLESLKEKSK